MQKMSVEGEYETEFTTLTLRIYTAFARLRRHSFPCLFSSPCTLHYNTRWHNYILRGIGMLACYLQLLHRCIDYLLCIPSGYYSNIVSSYLMYLQSLPMLRLFLVFALTVPQCHFLLKRLVRIPRASLRVTLGPAFQSAIFSLLDPLFDTG